MITEKQYLFIKNKIPYIILDDLKTISKKEASKIIRYNIIEEHPLLQWYVWEDKNTKTKYACTVKGNETEEYEDTNIKIYKKVFLKKRIAEDYHKTKLTFKTPRDYLLGSE